MYQQNKALIAAYNQLYFEFIASEKIKDINEDYHSHLQKYKEKASHKNEESRELKKESDPDEKLQKKIDKAMIEYDKAREKVYKTEKA
ncbi:hypothetical protein [Sporosarcina sp. NPDC096371]|uniref:hypothetical protein n=1 Tax=Sporosarcina sp. NPDC096371 TaxID=3364530 RepID=UPI0037FA7BC2